MRKASGDYSTLLHAMGVKAGMASCLQRITAIRMNDWVLWDATIVGHSKCIKQGDPNAAGNTERKNHFLEIMQLESTAM